DIQPERIPRLTTQAGVEVVVIAGQFDDGHVQQAGAVQRPDTEPQYFDFHLPAGSAISPKAPDGHRVLLYVYEGELEVVGQPQKIGTSRLARLSESGEVQLRSESGARVLLIAGKPLGEPIVQYGP